MTAPLQNPSEAEIVLFCKNSTLTHVIGGNPHGNLVLRLNNDIAVKFGWEVTRDEAESQKLASKLIDPRIALVPRVYRLFEDQEGLGYLVMEYVDGRVINPLQDDYAIRRVVSVLDHLASLRGSTPGSLSGGPSRGILFPDTEDITFDNVLSMEKWFNSRLFPHQPKVSFQTSELVLCHLDIAPRNILWRDNGDIYLLDWASAGFYPRIFELCTQWINNGKDAKFNTLLLDSLQSLTEHERSQKEPLLLAWNNMQRYTL